jgi:S-layer homology domain
MALRKWGVTHMLRTVRTLTLALAVGVLAGAGFWGTNALASHQFGDVGDNSQFHDDVGWMAQHGIASGFPDGNFRPTESVNRQQASRWFRNYNSSLQVVVNQLNPPAGSAFHVDADCGPLARPIAGGGIETAVDVYMRRSGPVGNTWSVSWESENNAVVDPSLIQVFALCAPDFSTG